MKSALRHIVYEEMKTTFSRFISISAIVALGVGIFAGLKATAPVMKNTADQYFDRQNLMDLRLLSTMGFTEDDVEAVKNFDGIESVMATYSVDALVESESGLEAVRIHALPDARDMNRPVLVEGRLPEMSGECVIDKRAANRELGGIGSTIVISGQNENDTLNMLKKREYTITGIVESPYYISITRGTTDIGDGNISGFIMIPAEDFKLDYYTELFVTVKGARELLSYSDEYDGLMDNMKNRLETLANERETIRYNDIVADAEEKLDKARSDLADTQRKTDEELAAAREKLDRSAADIEKSEEEIKRSEQELSNAVKELGEQKRSYYNQMERTQKQLDDAAAIIESQRKEYEAGLAAGIPESALEEAHRKLEAAEAELAARRAAFEAGRTAAEAKFKAAQAKIDSGYSELKENRAKLANAKAELEAGRKEYEERKAEAEKKLQDAKIKIDEAQQDLAGLEKPEWYVLGRDANPGFVSFGSDADRIDAITMVFPVFFFMVAALVCLTTMTRMVEEQRSQIGILKALGYGKVAIASKYLAYAGTATVLGSAAGLAAGFLTFPSVIFNAYCILYSLPPAILEFNVKYALISSLAAILCTTLATLWACYYELASVPAELVRPKAPLPGRRVLLEKIPFLWNRMSFIKKVTARNLFRFKKRFFMTTIGIGGCTALLLTGFGLLDSIKGIVSRQFGDIHLYDVIINLTDTGNSEGNTELNNELDRYFKEKLYVMQTSVDAEAEGENIEAYLFVPENAERLNNFISFRERVGGETVSFPQPGKVVLSEKLAAKLHVDVGDKFTIKKGELKRISAVVGGITENYIFNYIYMAPEDYRTAFGEAAEYRQLIGKLHNADNITPEDEQTISAGILKLDNVSSVSFIAKSRREFGDTMDRLNSVVVVIIISANLLALVVLYNLTNVNITERIREIATIKVLGFFNKEVSAYVYRENLILTLIGMFIGLVGGVFLHRYVVQTAEVDIVMFERNIKPLSYVWSALLTFAFAGLVDFIMYFKLRKISMTESLKSTE